MEVLLAEKLPTLHYVDQLIQNNIILQLFYYYIALYKSEHPLNNGAAHLASALVAAALLLSTNERLLDP